MSVPSHRGLTANIPQVGTRKCRSRCLLCQKTGISVHVAGRREGNRSSTTSGGPATVRGWASRQVWEEEEGQKGVVDLGRGESPTASVLHENSRTVCLNQILMTSSINNGHSTVKV